jgi:hypothetical protein
MVKFRLPRHDVARAEATCYRYGNHAWLAARVRRRHDASTFKILIEFNSVKFDKNSPRIRVDFAQKPRFIANDSFKPVC